MGGKRNIFLTGLDKKKHAYINADTDKWLARFEIRDYFIILDVFDRFAGGKHIQTKHFTVRFNLKNTKRLFFWN